METFKLRLKRLPAKEKLILIGGLLVIIGAFFPWYKDLDKFRTGDTFLGVTGPLYLAGIIILMCGVVSFGTIFSRLIGKSTAKLPFHEGYLHLGGAGLSILMIILTTSVYFHPKFGINLTEKTIGIGMLMAMVGVGLVILGSVLTIRKRGVNFEEEGKLEPLIDVADRIQSDIKPKIPEIKKAPERTPFEMQKSINSFLEENSLSEKNVNNPLNE
jgi:hypothetical protein